MPRYEILARTYIGSKLCEAGETVEYAGWPGSTLKPADSVATRIKTAFDDATKRGRNIPRLPDLAKYADPPEAPAADSASAAEAPKRKPGRKAAAVNDDEGEGADG